MGTATEELQVIPLSVEDRETLGIKIEDNGDLVFWAVGVDKQRTPNRRGLQFDWQQPADVDVAALMQNAVLLYLHDDDQLPIGRIEDVQITARRVRFKCRIPCYADVPNMGGHEEFLAPLRQLIADGYLKAVSIGFYIRESEDVEKDGQRYVRILKFEIVELSVCPIGAHETALIEQKIIVPKSVGIVAQSDSELIRLSLEVAAETFDCECIKCGYKLKSEKHCKDIKCPKCGGTMRRVERPGPGQDVTPDPEEQAWRAIPFARQGDTPKAPENVAWDGPKEVAAATPEKLSKMCALEDSEALDSKRGYKLPHHKASNLAVVWNGARAAMGAVLGARGGVKDASPEALKKAHGHLAREYKRFDKPAPPFKQDYTSEELRELHEQGMVLVPGMAPVDDIQEEAPSLSEQAAELLGELTAVFEELADIGRAKVEQIIARYEQLLAGEIVAVAEVPSPVAAPPVEKPAEPQAEDGADDEVLRGSMRAIISQSAEVRQAIAELVQIRLDTIRQKNRIS